jgi:hypothetical protein
MGTRVGHVIGKESKIRNQLRTLRGRCVQPRIRTQWREQNLEEAGTLEFNNAKGGKLIEPYALNPIY